VLEVVVPQGDCVLSSHERQGEVEALLDLLDERAPLALPALQGHIRLLSTQIRLALSQALLCARRLDAIHDHATLSLGAQAVALVAWAWLAGRYVARPVRWCCKVLTPRGVRSPLTCWRLGITRFEPGVQWSTGTALSGHMWPFIGPFLLVSSRCSPFGILIGLLLVESMRAFPLSNGREPSRPIRRGWQLWALLLSLLDRSHVSHGFEPCLNTVHT
jgi:hypothetical protein